MIRASSSLRNQACGSASAGLVASSSTGRASPGAARMGIAPVGTAWLNRSISHNQPPRTLQTVAVSSATGSSACARSAANSRIRSCSR